MPIYRPTNFLGVDHVGYTYASLTELVETYARLRDEGIRPYWFVHHGIKASMYFADRTATRLSSRSTASHRATKPLS